MKKLFLVILCFFPFSANADYEYWMLDIKCIPEFNYISIGKKLINEAFEYKEFGSGGEGNSESNLQKEEKLRLQEEREDLLKKKYSLVDMAGDFEYTCRLPNSTYKIKGYTPKSSARGACGGEPMTKISVFRNEKPVVDDVNFIENFCGKDLYLDSIVVREKGLNYSDEAYYININTNRNIQNSSNWILKDFLPIDKNTLSCLAKSKDGYSLTKENDFIICSKKPSITP